MNSESVGSHPRMSTASCLLVPRGTVSLFFTGLAPCWQSGPLREVQCVPQYIHSSVFAARVVFVADRLVCQAHHNSIGLRVSTDTESSSSLANACRDLIFRTSRCCVVLYWCSSRAQIASCCVLARCIEQLVGSRLQNYNL
jgi:hypothetical protein